MRSKRTATLLGALGAACAIAAAYDIAWLNLTDGLHLGVRPEQVDRVEYTSGGATVTTSLLTGDELTVSASRFASVTLGQTQGQMVDVTFGSGGVDVWNPLAFEGVTAEVEGSRVTLTLPSGNPPAVQVSGTTADGQLKIYCDSPVTVALNGASITCGDGSALNLQCPAGATLSLSGTSTLCDGGSYSLTPADESEKGAVSAAGPLTVTGSGSLSVKGTHKHAICSDDGVAMKSGAVTVTGAASDGIHCCGFTITGGSVATAATGGDAIDADTGAITASGGSLDLAVPTADTKGLKADADITLSGAAVKLAVSGDQAKGIKTKTAFTMTGGSLDATLTGNAVVADYQASYCTAVKADATLKVASGTVVINGSGKGNKGLSADAGIDITGGDITITLTGAGATFKLADNNNDSYCSTCITTDTDCAITGGTLTLSNSGSAGKCVKADGTLTLGAAGTDGPTVTAKTTGQRLTVGSTSGGGWGPGGGGSSTDYANPKVMKAGGNLHALSGTYTISASANGGEGLESKATATFDGGTYLITTYDDCINAASHLQINDGHIYCRASGNDAIDSNGTLTIAGGVTIAIGAKQPEDGFDCDNNRFTITGGVAVGMAGGTSTPTTNYCTQRSVIYSYNLASGSMLTLTDPSGNHILSFTSPVSLGTSATFLITSPLMQADGTYTFYTGGTLTGGTAFECLTTEGTYTPGSSVKTFTPTSMVTNLGSSGGGGGWP